MLAACPHANSGLKARTCVSRVAGLCQTTPHIFTSTDLAAEAAQVCERCPHASACLLAALHLDAAHRHGRDPWGISGVCGGVFFAPGHPPRRLPSAGEPPVAAGDRATTSASDARDVSDGRSDVNQEAPTWAA